LILGVDTIGNYATIGNKIIRKEIATMTKKGQDLRATNIRGIPGEVYRMLRVEAAWQEISINQLIINILTKDSKEVRRKRESEVINGSNLRKHLGGNSAGAE